MESPSRRDFLRLAGAAAGLAAASSVAAQIAVPADISMSADLAAEERNLFDLLYPGAWSPKLGWKLPELPYPANALEAAIDARTMELHHQRHHRAYVDGVRNAEEQLSEARSSGDFSMVEHWSRKLTFHGGGHLLHCIFWACMGPEPTDPTGNLLAAIERDFGSYDQMMRHFSAAAIQVEGSGWARLVYNFPSGRLSIQQSLNQNLLTSFGEYTLLALDVWEHAYYLRYQADRRAYVEAFPKVINWANVSRRFDAIHQLHQHQG